MKSTWEKIPERRRGGGTEYLTHKLLEKVGKAEKGYVAYLKAVTRDKPTGSLQPRSTSASTS